MEAGFAKCGIPERMRPGIRDYLVHGHPAGGFLTAIITNDLRGSFERADWENQQIILNYLKFFYNHAPSPAWGSKAKYDEWRKIGGWDGLDNPVSLEGGTPAA